MTGSPDRGAALPGVRPRITSMICSSDDQVAETSVDRLAAGARHRVALVARPLTGL